MKRSMSPEIAASIVQDVACPYCMAPIGSRCRGLGINSRPQPTPHQKRVYASLFRKASR